MTDLQPIIVKHLFKPLNDELMLLLEALTPDEWDMPTVAKMWTVKDIAAHLLDGNLRALSIQRDKYFGESPPVISGYIGLVNWLNKLNADWVKAAKRISPQILIMLHKATADQVTSYYESIDPEAEAIFSVAWAGEAKSLNWMHLAREYTEKWHHQQQIREATGHEGIVTPRFFFPLIDTFFRALPYTFKDVTSAEGTCIKVSISGEAGGNWYLYKKNQDWQLINNFEGADFITTVTIPAHISWKLFSKSIRPAEIMDDVSIKGNHTLAMQVLHMVSVMA